jgi:AhpD family alkylhydroperoxidase
MHDRISFPRTAPELHAAIRDLDARSAAGLEQSLVELVRTRASQINGCAFCLDMHTRDARKNGETEQRLYVLSAWRETPFFSARERAALAWTECLTRLSIDGAPEPVYRDLTEHFSPAEIATLTALIGTINVWNRIAVGLSRPMRVPAKAA